MKRMIKAGVAGFVALAIGAAHATTSLADEPSKATSQPSTVPPGLSTLAHQVIDLVMEHHVDPPARQQMILTGMKAVYKAAGTPSPDGLSRRVSMVVTPEQLGNLLGEIWPSSTSANRSRARISKRRC